MRPLLVGLLVVSLACAPLLAAVDQRAARATCEPVGSPVPTAEVRVLTQPDDGCLHLRLRAGLHAHALLLLADALALGVALLWRSPRRVLGIVAPLALLVPVMPAALLSLIWQARCGPIESYVGGCAHPRWLFLPWVVLSLVVIVAVSWDARRAPPSPRR